MGADAIEIVRAYVRRFNERIDLDEPLDHIDPAFEMTEAAALPGAASVKGLDELRTYMLGWERNWSDWSWHERAIEEVAPGRVLLDATLRLRGKRSGAEVERRWAYLFTLRDGRVLRQDGFTTREEALAALEGRAT